MPVKNRSIERVMQSQSCDMTLMSHQIDSIFKALSRSTEGKAPVEQSVQFSTKLLIEFFVH